MSTSFDRREWYWWYIDLLRRLGLPGQANDLTDDNDDETIAALNKNMTSVYAACANCKRPIGSATHTWCGKCKAALST